MYDDPRIQRDSEHSLSAKSYKAATIYLVLDNLAIMTAVDPRIKGVSTL